MTNAAYRRLRAGLSAACTCRVGSRQKLVGVARVRLSPKAMNFPLPPADADADADATTVVSQPPPARPRLRHCLPLPVASCTSALARAPVAMPPGQAPRAAAPRNAQPDSGKLIVHGNCRSVAWLPLGWLATDPPRGTLDPVSKRVRVEYDQRPPPASRRRWASSRSSRASTRRPSSSSARSQTQTARISAIRNTRSPPAHMIPPASC